MTETVNLENLNERKFELMRQISTLEWDKSRKQMHIALEVKLDQLKKELEEIQTQLIQE